jgi:hypothetical protein
VLAVRIVTDPTDATPSYYVNYAEASFGPHEVSISFVKVPTKLNSAQLQEAKDAPLRLEPVVQVLFAPTLLPGIIRALNTIKDRYEEHQGPIRGEQGEKNE